MARCLHIYDSGFQCVDETIESTDFCDVHQRVIPFERLEDSPWRKFVFRVVAFVLLVTLLIPLIYSLKNLYRGTPAQAREVW
jgi:hypothetical protein